MAQFNLNEYETVDQRLARLHADSRFKDVRVITINHTSPLDRQVSTWVVECRIYLNRADQLDNLPVATGWAFEVDGVGMANKTSALENAETSARGRALQALAMSGSKQGPSREEMEKVQRNQTPRAQGNKPQPKPDLTAFLKSIDAAKDEATLKDLWNSNKESLDAVVPGSPDVTFKQYIINAVNDLKNATF
jgi:hypothetical protein